MAEGSGELRLASVPSESRARADDSDVVPDTIGGLLSRLRFEAAVLALLLFTFAAIQFQALFTTKELVITPHNRSLYAPYSYGDQTSGGRSTATIDPVRALKWSCDLRPGYAYPFCGYGILFDQSAQRRGIDFSDFQQVTIKFRYTGPGDKMQIALINNPLDASEAGANKPNQLQFPVRQGAQTVMLNLSDLAVADWWVAEQKSKKELAAPRIDNVTALEIQPGAAAELGHHEYALDSITLVGKQISQAQYYLLLLGVWVLLIGAFLIHRFVKIRKGFERRHQRQVRERQQLVVAKTVAESASAAKSAFLANMSHELRTPLNAILGYAQLLEREQLTERQAGAARTIHQSGVHLLTLITDILDLSKIEAGRLDLQQSRFDLEGCICGVADMMRIRAEEKGLAFVCALGDDLPTNAVGDEKRLRQVLINLLGNAIKFTETGQISLAASKCRTHTGGAGLRIEVRDTGTGMNPEHLSRIFDAFEQVGSAENRASGTGLGLGISRQIVELMGGRIEVESAQGQGSRFWFEIPLEIVSALPPPERCARPAVTGYAGTRRRLLVIDDDEANRTLLLSTLGDLGFNTDSAGDGRSGVEAVLLEPPDMVLTGLKMPVMDGFEAMRQLRARRELEALPIIAYSADATSENAARARHAGADAFIASPIEIAELTMALKELLDLRWTAGATLDAPQEPQRAAAPIPPLAQLEKLHELAKRGNMRAIREFVNDLADANSEYRPYAEEVNGLAAAYRSPAILDLVSQHISKRKAA
ncbi:ATP-binding protein [Sphingomonas sp. ST-64]|uniref:histidine kinase n=1 Tax=Sphingomonas plantiphila TaxID=3163295 RepID=A0ABW8YMJ2_9SPHN